MENNKLIMSSFVLLAGGLLHTGVFFHNCLLDFPSYSSKTHYTISNYHSGIFSHFYLARRVNFFPFGCRLSYYHQWFCHLKIILLKCAWHAVASHIHLETWADGELNHLLEALYSLQAY